jgi:hypothetical protein
VGTDANLSNMLLPSSMNATGEEGTGGSMAPGPGASSTLPDIGAVLITRDPVKDISAGQVLQLERQTRALEYANSLAAPLALALQQPAVQQALQQQAALNLAGANRALAGGWRCVLCSAGMQLHCM